MARGLIFYLQMKLLGRTILGNDSSRTDIRDLTTVSLNFGKELWGHYPSLLNGTRPTFIRFSRVQNRIVLNGALTRHMFPRVMCLFGQLLNTLLYNFDWHIIKHLLIGTIKQLWHPMILHSFTYATSALRVKTFSFWILGYPLLGKTFYFHKWKRCSLCNALSISYLYRCHNWSHR